jgi:hypothetical protein
VKPIIPLNRPTSFPDQRHPAVEDEGTVGWCN